MNNALSLKKRHKTSHLTRMVLLISFLIMAGRLIYAIPGAIEHHQQQRISPTATEAKPAAVKP